MIADVARTARLLCVVLTLALAQPCQAAADPGSMDLSGPWQCRLDPKDEGIVQKWFDAALPQQVKLPGSLAENGLGDDISVATKWTGSIVDRSWFKDPKYAKYREPGNVKVPFWLTPVKHYVGPAWYAREVEIPEAWRDKRVVLFLERCHWETQLWIDGRHVGMQDSLCTPHEYDLTGLLAPGKHRLALRVDNRVKINVGENAHSVSDHTQTNWNGIIGRMELLATEKVGIEDVQVYPDVGKKTGRVRVSIRNALGRAVDAALSLAAESFAGPRSRSHHVAAAQSNVKIPPEGISIEVKYALGDDALPWDEFDSTLYRLTTSIATEHGGRKPADRRETTFGFREFKSRGTQFTINGRPTFLRGTLECCIFPLTGYPPMDVASWERIIRVAKDHGLNHFRFHSCCPPEAAFEAADRLGFYFHVETPVWTTLGHDPKVDAFIRAEADRIMKYYGNHPSFCMLAVGNEPSGKKQGEFLSKIVADWKKNDPRRLYTSCSGWPIIAESDFHSCYGPRIHMWGAGLKSRVNAEPLSSESDYRDWVAKHKGPIVSHEVGQWCVYPNFDEIKKYTGVTRAGNFEIFRDSLAEHGMADQAHDFLIASGKLQTLLYKEEIEAALRTPGFGGFQLLDLHDFPGQGTALVGVLDPFWESKGYVTPEEFRQFCGPTVPLVRMKKCVWTSDETFTATAEVAHYSLEPLRDIEATWTIATPDGQKMASGDWPAIKEIPVGGCFALGCIELPLGKMPAPTKLILTVSVDRKGSPYMPDTNHWDLWVYPAKADPEKGVRTIYRGNDRPPSQRASARHSSNAINSSDPFFDVLVTSVLDDAAAARLRSGGKVVLLAPPASVRSDVPPGFSTVFWNTMWTGRQPPVTLGILCDPKHPALAKFPTEFHSNWQWWDLVAHGRSMILDGLPKDFRPIVQVIDDWTTNRKLGLVFEAKVEGGKLLVCSIDLASDLEKRPVARQMLRSLLDYAGSAAFAPQKEVSPEAIRALFQVEAKKASAPAGKGK